MNRTKLGIAIWLIASVNGAYADAVSRGSEIAHAVHDRARGFRDLTADLEMVLRNRQGEESRRVLQVRALEVVNDGDNSIITFTDPPDVRGAALLTHAHKAGEDDQWLYLPAIKRIKRISSSNRTGPFMGSEFAYEDLASQEVEKYRYMFIKEEKCDTDPCQLLARYPLDKDSGYARQLMWVDPDYRIRKIEFYDRKDALLKILTLNEYRLYLGKLWRAHTMDMENVQTGKSTTLKWINYRFNNGFTRHMFEPSRIH